MEENLSVPLAFVALLHLVNENNLCLTSQLDLTDFAIHQEWTSESKKISSSVFWKPRTIGRKDFEKICCSFGSN